MTQAVQIPTVAEVADAMRSVASDTPTPSEIEMIARRNGEAALAVYAAVAIQRRHDVARRIGELNRQEGGEQ